MTQGTEVQSQVESYQRLKKWSLIPPCLTLSIIRYVSRVKWINPGKRVATSLTPWCSSCRKWSLRVALDYSHQLHFTYICVCVCVCLCVCVCVFVMYMIVAYFSLSFLFLISLYPDSLACFSPEFYIFQLLPKSFKRSSFFL